MWVGNDRRTEKHAYDQEPGDNEYHARENIGGPVHTKLDAGKCHRYCGDDPTEGCQEPWTGSWDEHPRDRRQDCEDKRGGAGVA